MCIYFRIRSKKYKKYIYCNYLKKEIKNFECKECQNKNYKKKKAIKGKKHKQTKYTEISRKVKEAVWERDNHECIFCGKEVSVFYANAHFIPRSAGGLGIEENIFTACENCHREQDNGQDSKEYDEDAENHLKSIYGENWHKKNLIYRKYNKG